MRFDDLTDIYDAMIDWPKRLAAEAAFYRPVFDRAGVKRVADVACGTGRQAAMFRDWGLNVTGTDISPAMIERARELHGESDQLQWRVQGFESPVAEPGSIDAVVCLGNSLALAESPDVASKALCTMLSAVRQGGVVVVHVLNLWRIPPGPCVWQKAVPRTIDGGEVLILKGVHRCGETGRVELLVVPRDRPDELRAESVPFLGLHADDLASASRACGAEPELFGSLKGDAYDSDVSGDMILIATKRN